MQTTLIILMVAIFLAWLYIQQKRLAAYERYCMDWHKVSLMTQPILKQVNEEMKANLVSSLVRAATAAKQAAESFAEIKNSLETQKSFICQGCNIECYEGYCLKTVGFCYLCDPNIPLQDLLDPNITADDIKNSTPE